MHINPDDKCTHHVTLAFMLSVGASILKIGSTSTKARIGGSYDMLCTWWLSWLAVESALISTVGSFQSR